MLTAGADVHLRDSKGKTALMWAKLNDNIYIVQLLEQVERRKLIRNPIKSLWLLFLKYHTRANAVKPTCYYIWNIYSFRLIQRKNALVKRLRFINYWEC